MDILVCIKRVPATGAKMVLTADEQAIETRNLGFTISPHEECAVEEAVQINERLGGTTTVLTLGPAEAVQQLRDVMAVGADRGVLLETDIDDWGPMATAAAITTAIKQQNEAGHQFDMIFFGNESADSGGYQVGIRVAHALDLPCVSGIKQLAVGGETAVAGREAAGGWELYEVPLPAVFTIKEGISLPRYPSLPGRLRAKKKPLETNSPQQQSSGLEKIRLKTPVEQGSKVEILGEGSEAATQVVDMLQEMGVL